MPRNVVILMGGPGVQNEESAAVEAILPGHLVTFSGAGVAKHATAGGEGARTFAIERDEVGKDYLDAYAIGDFVKVSHLQMGARVYALIPSGQNLAKGAFLESDGAGRFRVFASGVRIARTLEAVNNSAGPGDARIRIELI